MLRKIALVLAVAPGLWLTTAFALSLGEISVHSQLNQRFSAVIPLYDVSAEDAAALQVKVADNDAFAKAGIERAAYLSSLNFKVQTENGASQVVVSSSKIAREPFLSFLLDVNSKSTQLMRAYTVLLDPPDYSEPASATAATPAPATTAAADTAEEPPAPEPVPTPVPAQTATPESAASVVPVEATHASPVSPVAAEASEFTPASATPSVYGPVKAGETLWHIATQLRSSNSVTMNQVMLAIHNANPRAFDDGRLHVQKGAMLKVPTLAQIRAVNPAAAAERIDRIKRGHAAGNAAAKPARRAKSAKPAVAKQSEPAPASEPASAPEPEVTAQSPSPAAATAEEAAPSVAAQSAEPAADAAASASAQAAAASAYAEPVKPGSTAAAAPTAPATETAAPADTLPGSVPTQSAEQAAPAAASEPPAQPQPIPSAQPAPSKPKVVTAPSSSMQGLLYPLIAALVVLLLGLLGLQTWKKRQNDKARRKIEPIQGLKFGIPQPPNAGTASAPALKIPDLPVAAAVAATQKISTAADTAQLPQFDSTQMVDAPLEVKTSKAISTDSVDFDVTGKFEAETMKVDLDGDDPITEADFHLAYGLYDEAALLLSNAAKKEPKRTDIRTKLAETYFRAGKALEFQETAETLKPEVSPAEWQKIAIMGHQLMPDSELFGSGGNLDAESLGDDVDLAFDEPAAAPAPKPSKPAATQFSAPSTHTLDFSLEDFDAVTTAAPTTPAPKVQAPAAASPSDHTLEFNLGDFDLEKPAAKETVAPAAAPTLPADEVKIDDDFSLDNMPDDSHAISTGDEAATKLDLARAYVDMGDNETAVTLLNEVMLQGSDAQKKDAEALIKRMA